MPTLLTMLRLPVLYTPDIIQGSWVYIVSWLVRLGNDRSGKRGGEHSSHDVSEFNKLDKWIILSKLGVGASLVLCRITEFQPHSVRTDAQGSN